MEKLIQALEASRNYRQSHDRHYILIDDAIALAKQHTTQGQPCEEVALKGLNEILRATDVEGSGMGYIAKVAKETIAAMYTNSPVCKQAEGECTQSDATRKVVNVAAPDATFSMSIKSPTSEPVGVDDIAAENQRLKQFIYNIFVQCLNDFADPFMGDDDESHVKTMKHCYDQINAFAQKQPDWDSWDFGHEYYQQGFEDGAESATPNQVKVSCKVCGGNDADAPCAYPEYPDNKCLRTKRLSRKDSL